MKKVRGRWIGWRSMRNRCDHRRCRVELNGEAPFRPEAVGRAHLTRFRAASGRLSSSRCGGRVGESVLTPLFPAGSNESALLRSRPDTATPPQDRSGSARLPEPRRARRPIRLAVAPPVSLCIMASRVGDEWSRRPGERNPFRLHFVVDPQHSFKATSAALDRIST
jgi:hypothetical protein